MSAATTTYVDAFLTKKPKDSIHIVRERLTNAATLTNELADYFKERAQIEETYAKSLSDASKKLYTKDLGILGHFAPVWECLLKEFNQIATYHSDMAFQIMEQVEKPLRKGATSEEHQRLQQLENSILAKDGKKTVKGTLFKKSKSSYSLWQNEGADYLQLHQKVDESRLNRMKTVVERFEQIQSGQLMERVKMSKVTLTQAEAFNAQHDISDFCTQRAKALSSSSSPTLDTSSTPSKTSKRFSTISHSFDPHRSTNKFKSVFMKKKKHSDMLSDPDDHSSSHTGYSAVTEEELSTPLDATLLISPPSTSPSIVDHFSTTTNTAQHVPLSRPPTTTTTSGMNTVPLVDSDGYAIPSNPHHATQIASDVSSRNTLDDVESFQSLKLNQKLQINIKEDAVKEDTNIANESYTKMATMLRERAPTLNRRARGRREKEFFFVSTLTRSQTDTTLTNNPSAHSADSSPRVVSMMAVSSHSGNSTNPFLKGPSFSAIYARSDTAMPRSSSMVHATHMSPEPPSPSSSSCNSRATTSWPPLQSIPEVTTADPSTAVSSPFPPLGQAAAAAAATAAAAASSSSQSTYITASITETTHTTDPSLLHVTGRIQIYLERMHATAPAEVPLRLKHTNGIRHLEPNTEYLRVVSEDEEGEVYMLQTDKIDHSQAIPLFTYDMMLDATRALPIRLSPSWKCVEGTSYLILKYQPRPSAFDSHGDITGHVSVDMSQERVQHVQSTPQGRWDQQKRRLTWKLSDVLAHYAAQGTEEARPPRLLAKFYVEGQSSPAPIYLNYRIQNTLLSGIQLVCEDGTIQKTEKIVQSKQDAVYS
ncbi:Muniscin C-terminal mu homology domain-containing protein [Mycotypha africana]|uniref:muniscin domain-containing protein n=1 Tax=Mycotypha africana TaxID=64632 RepID=UPI00230000E2|nr:muniscin domain-containing protein [Mycotypha africana]KAI8981724.1 Muniscin C-terminal mu homology domain-containing protein [Mycotypha africana]